MASIAQGAPAAGVETNRPGRYEHSGAPAAQKADPLEKEYQQLLDRDNEAQEEVDRWIREYREFAAKGAPAEDEALNRRIRERLAPVRKGYEDFLREHPEHVRARIAFASFLGDVESETAALEHLEIALRYDTNNPTIYNNMANIHGHIGDVKKAFEFYSKAIALAPDEPVYYHNFGTTVYLFRKDAREYFNIDEQQVFTKAFALYSNALRLDPDNFPLASDVAQTYYGVKPLRANDAMKAWTNALSLAHDEVEREGVYLHFARIRMLEDKHAEARSWLDRVTNSMYADLKRRVLRSIEQRANPATNATATATNSQSAKPASPGTPGPK